MGEIDELSWSRIYREIDDMDYLSEPDKNRIRKGWSYLEAILGSEWLAISNRIKHPWIYQMSYNGLWSKSIFGLIGEKLNDLQDVPGFDIKIEELKRPTKKALTITTEFNAAWKLFRNDIDIEFVSENPKNQSADIIARVNETNIQIEVTSLETPSHYFIQQRNLSKIAETLNHPQTYAGCRIYRNLSSTRTNHIVHLIEEMIELTLERNHAIKRWERDTFDICLAPLSLKQDVDDWKVEHKMRPETSLIGPIVNTHQGRKLQSTIFRKSNQISENNPGVIFIEGVPFHIFGDSVSKTAPFEDEFVEEPLYENTNLLFLVFNNFTFTKSREIGLQKVDSHKRKYLAKYRAAPCIDDETWLTINRFHKWDDLIFKPLLDAFWYVDPNTYLFEDWWEDAKADLVDKMRKKG